MPATDLTFFFSTSKIPWLDICLNCYVFPPFISTFHFWWMIIIQKTYYKTTSSSIFIFLDILSSNLIIYPPSSKLLSSLLDILLALYISFFAIYSSYIMFSFLHVSFPIMADVYFNVPSMLDQEVNLELWCYSRMLSEFSETLFHTSPTLIVFYNL